MDETPEYPEYIICHSDHGDPECCGLLFAVKHDGSADFRCNECGAIVRTVIERRNRSALAAKSPEVSAEPAL